MLVACAGLAFVGVNCEAFAIEDVTTFKQFYQLSRGQAKEGRPVRIQGVVLSYDLEWGQLYVHDGSETRWFNPREISTRPASGQLVEVTGTTTFVDNSNTLTNLNLTVLKVGAFPVAKRTTPAQLTNDLGEWIEMIGRVRLVEFSRGRMQLLLHENGQGCGVYVMGAPQTNEVRRLLGAKVRVRGINNSGDLELVSVVVPGMEQVTVLEPADANQVLPPAISIDNLLNRELGDWTNSPVHINGSVIASEPGKLLLIKDPTGVMRAQVVQATIQRKDDRVDVYGFLKVTPTETILSSAWFEVVKPTLLAGAGDTTLNPSVGEIRKPEVLTNVAEILKLRREESTQRWPVRLRGTVLYADPEWRNGFFQDQGSAIYFDLNQKDVRPGQWVELMGETGPGGFAPEIVNTSVKVLGTTNLPTAARVDLTDLADGHMDAQWLQLEGVIRRVNLEWDHLSLVVMTHKGKFNAVIPGLGNQMAPTNLVDASVSIQGACTTQVNARQQVSGVTLHVPSLAQIRILEPAPTEPFTVATTPIARVATFDPDRVAGRRVKVSGVVTLKIPDQGFLIQDAGGGIFVRQQQMNGIEPGDVAEVLGFPALGDFSPELEEVSFRRTGNTNSPAARKTTAEGILLHGANDGMLVTLEARLLQSVPRSANPQLVLQDGAIIFTARLQDAGQGWQMPALESGSVVRLSGVCSIQGGERNDAKSFRLRLRSPTDVMLISSPPWWTAQRTLWVFGGFGGVFVISLGWVRVLRQQVRRRTGELRTEIEERKRTEAQLESEITERERTGQALRASEAHLQTVVENLNEGVVVCDLHGGLLHWNRAALKIHGFAGPEDGRRPLTELADTFELSAMDGTPIAVKQWPLSRILRAENLRDLELRVRNIKADWERVFSYSGTLVHDADEQPVLAIVTINDVTERKQAEAELEQTNKELLGTSRQAGMAEVATSVLHNVGNVLNSVNVASTCLADSLRKSKAANLSKVVTMLREHETDLGAFLTNDSKGKQLPGYLAQLAAHLAGEQAAALKELAELQKNIEHIKDIVTMQQSFAKTSGVTEIVNVTDLVEDALRINLNGLARHHIEVIKEFKATPLVTVEKHKVLQILINLVRNAKHACEASDLPEKKLTIRTTNGANRVRIAVCDTGVGILSEHLIRIFSHGFTTKKDGHGFGLHSGALAAKEMGGNLTVHSEGIGKGATFTLELPLTHDRAQMKKAE